MKAANRLFLPGSLILLLSTLCLWCVAVPGGTAGSTPSVSLINLTAERVVLNAEPPSTRPGRYSFTLSGPQGELAVQSGRHPGHAFAVRFDAEIEVDKKPLYVVEWSFDDGPPQRRSLHFLLPLL